MEQQSTQISLKGKQDAATRFRWMRYFFTEAASARNHLIVDFQRRVSWIVLAITLQSLNQVADSSYLRNSFRPVGHVLASILGPFGRFNNVIFILGSFVAMWMALRPASWNLQTRLSTKGIRYWQRFIVLLIFVLSIAGVYVLGQIVVMC